MGSQNEQSCFGRARSRVFSRVRFRGVPLLVPGRGPCFLTGHQSTQGNPTQAVEVDRLVMDLVSLVVFVSHMFARMCKVLVRRGDDPGLNSF